MICPRCGATMASDSRFCIECGYDVGDRDMYDGSTDVNHTVVISTPNGPGSNGYSPNANPYDVKCPSCGAYVDPTRAYCTSCGMALNGVWSGSGEGSGSNSDSGGYGSDPNGGNGTVQPPAQPALPKRRGWGAIPTVTKIGLVLAVVVAVVGVGAFLLMPAREEKPSSLVVNATFDDTLLCINGIETSDGDEITMSEGLINAESAWVITSSDSYNLEIVDGLPTAKLKHGALGDDASGIVLVEQKGGAKRFCPARIRTAQQILGDYKLSPLAEHTKKGYTLSTDVKDNKFNAVEVQLMNGDTGEYIKNIMRIEDEGDVQEDYVFTDESGSYVIRLKANSNLHDEYVDFPVHMDKDFVYRYSFHVDKLASKEIKVSAFQVRG